jgi:putative heme-binding domain-containing protein
MADRKILDVIRHGVPGTEMMGFPIPEPQLKQLVAFIRSLNFTASQQDVAGDVVAGRSLFFGKADCVRCHMIAGRGGWLGPDLSSIGANLSLAKIVESVRQPNAYIEPGYRRITVVTKAGRRIDGIAKNDSNYSIQILDVRGNFQLLRKQELQKIIYYKDSLMPVPVLSEKEFQDLLAFLSRQARGGVPDAL